MTNYTGIDPKIERGKLIRIMGRLGGLASLGPLGAGYLKGALRLTFHMAMKSWNNKAARSAEKF